MKNLFVVLIIIMTVINASLAQSTKLIVRAKAKDAKFIGTSIGGAKVVIRDALTGEILDEGVTQGGTGDTDLIMKQPVKRYQTITDDQTAKFEADINITEPQFVTIEVLAPLNQPQARVAASTQVWLIPGKHIDGEGIVLEIPGFIVNVLSPQTHEALDNPKVTIKANVVMMCGCTISNGGLWDAEKMEVQALIKKEGKLVKTIPLKVLDQVNTFTGEVDLSEGGMYEMIIYAYDSRTGNTGVDKVNFIVRD